MCPCDLAQAPLDEAATGVPPENDLCRRQSLLCGRLLGQFCAEPRAELVRVEVENGEVAQVPRRQDAPVAPAAGDWELPQVPKLVRLGRDVADAVGYARRVELAGVVPKSSGRQDLERPGRPPVDREGGGPVGDRLPPGRVGDHLDGATQVGTELVRRLVVHARVGVAVASGLVPAPPDLRYEVAMVVDGHPEQEERRPRSKVVEQVEQVGRLAFERRVRPVPICEPEPPVDELVPVLEVDRQQQPWLLHRGDCKGWGQTPRGLTPAVRLTPGLNAARSLPRRVLCPLPSRGTGRRRRAGRATLDRLPAAAPPHRRRGRSCPPLRGAATRRR